MTFREKEIRPDEFTEGQVERYAADVRRLVARKSEFLQVPCPACDTVPAHKVFDKYGLEYVECLACGTVYINPRPPPAVLDDYYATSENYAYWNKYIFPASENARREKIFRPRAERIVEICRRNGSNGGTLLEVGAGFGTFGEEMKRMSLFQRMISVEPTPDLAQTCRRKGLEVVGLPIEKVELKEVRVDVVVSFEVLEHLFCPKMFLLKCFSLLRPGGLVVVTCPNIKGFDIMTLGPLSGSIDTEHLNYFHPASLSLLFGLCGLETLEVMTPGRLDAELVRKQILAGKYDVSQQPFLKQVLIDEWEKLGSGFQNFLAENQLSSHMWIVGRKPKS